DTIVPGPRPSKRGAPARPVTRPAASRPAAEADERLVDALLEAATAGGEALAAAAREAVAASGAALPALAEALGRRASGPAAEALRALTEAPGVAREARKAARAALHRL